jgi:hypothetical protein
LNQEDKRTVLITRVLAVVVLLVAAASAHAAHTGLVIIPTAETVGAGQYSAELEVGGALSDFATDTRILNTQFGFNDRFEAGLDFDFSRGSDTDVLVNAKYLFSVDNRREIYLAAGTCNTHPNAKCSPYIVCTKCLKPCRLHLGGIRTEGNNRWFTGIDRGLNDRLTVMADFTSGDENYSSAGFEQALSGRFSVLAGALFPNAGGATEYTLQLVYAAAYR